MDVKVLAQRGWQVKPGSKQRRESSVNEGKLADDALEPPFGCLMATSDKPVTAPAINGGLQAHERWR
jgi:hypothetical protein